jgi:hypothetical protein
MCFESALRQFYPRHKQQFAPKGKLEKKSNKNTPLLTLGGYCHATEFQEHCALIIMEFDEELRDGRLPPLPTPL